VRLYPAIDILGGNAVRLVKGDFAAKTVYDEDPLSAARGWTEAGARFLHVVDLDGAKTGRPVNVEQLRRIATLGVPIQYGGGLRSLDALDDALSAGAERVILGTAAFTDPGLLGRALERHGPERVVVSVDVRGGEVAIDGWTRSADVGVREIFSTLIEQGVRELAYTNVDRDGMLGGPDTDEVRRISESVGEGRFIYSGGIGALEHLEALRALDLPNLGGVISGKALYEGRFGLEEAREALS
jgi:phosphoribosylformimino-5-aminoimidazole carboxamide ribotide isomerase